MSSRIEVGGSGSDGLRALSNAQLAPMFPALDRHAMGEGEGEIVGGAWTGPGREAWEEAWLVGKVKIGGER